MAGKLRRKGKPFNPASSAALAEPLRVHDRQSHDLLKNARVAPVEVDDPYEQGAKIMVLRSTRHDPLADMKAKGQIDQCDYMAGRHFQAAWENAEIGQVRGIDPSKEAVDGGKMPEVLTDQQRKGAQDLKASKDILGREGYLLVSDILAKGLSISQAALHRGLLSEADKKYIGKRFRECLSTLAVRFGYANREKEEAY